MSRPTYLYIHAAALLHNIQCIRRYAPMKKIVAVVKSNAYGCGLSTVIPTLDGHVDLFAVACIEEAIELRHLGSRSDCLLLQGIFHPEELRLLEQFDLQCVVHQKRQLQWILARPLQKKIKIWIKIDTGMHRLGFSLSEAEEAIQALKACTWVEGSLVLMTHLSSSDEPHLAVNQQQLVTFNRIAQLYSDFPCSLANSGAIIALPELHGDIVRAGIILYGVSPFGTKTGSELGLMPVMELRSALSSIHHYPAHEPIGYSRTWQSDKPSIIGVVPIGYGDGYPRHVAPGTLISIHGEKVPIVGRVSMDMLTVDLSHCPQAKEGDIVELWGKNVPIEHVAKQSGTIAYELMCQLTRRVREDFLYNKNTGGHDE